MGKSLIYSYKAAIVLLVVYAAGLAIATFIEKYWGTELAKMIVYYSPIFILLQLFLVVNFIFTSLKHQLFKKGKWGFLFIHAALIVILAGALTSHIFSREGMVHLRENETVEEMLVRTNKGDAYYRLPFSLELVKFTMTRYPGSDSPSSFESHLKVHADNQIIEKRVSMNNVLDMKGYRFFQASYDRDEKGSILSVNKDVAGRNVTYTGYALLVMGFILGFTGKNSRFRRLAGELKQLQTTSKLLLTGLLFFVFTSSLSAQNPLMKEIHNLFQENKIDAAHAAAFGALPLQSIEGRLEPVNTFSSEVLRKLNHSEKIGNLNSDQFLLSLIASPEIWAYVPFITLKNEDIAVKYNLSKKQFAYTEIFDETGNYKLQDDLDVAFAKSPSKRTRFDKDLIKLDEQINIFYQLVENQMINIFPQKDDTHQRWSAHNEVLLDAYLESVRQAVQTGNWKPADENLAAIQAFQKNNTTLTIDTQKIKTELLYNRLNIFRQCKKFYLIFGGISLILTFVLLFRRGKGLIWSVRLLFLLISLALLYHLAGICIRWYIAGYAPWSNAYETMIYVSFITVAAGLLFSRRSAITFALATLFGGIILFVSGLNWMDPQISPLVPVLKSPWLMIHVAVIVAAYGFFGIGFLLGTTNLSLMAFNRDKKHGLLATRIRELTIINEMALLAGLALMTIGTFLGAVWANESWGRYWGWDPKETWALVTILVYVVVTHLQLVKKWDNPRLFNWLSILAFACVLMTYFGVNYYLSGMHSYGS
jgi:cytochrome c-type biogenesis protein CcsB